MTAADVPPLESMDLIGLPIYERSCSVTQTGRLPTTNGSEPSTYLPDALLPTGLQAIQRYMRSIPVVLCHLADLQLPRSTAQKPSAPPSLPAIFCHLERVYPVENLQYLYALATPTFALPLPVKDSPLQPRDEPPESRGIPHLGEGTVEPRTDPPLATGQPTCSYR